MHVYCIILFLGTLCQQSIWTASWIWRPLLCKLAMLNTIPRQVMFIVSLCRLRKRKKIYHRRYFAIHHGHQESHFQGGALLFPLTFESEFLRFSIVVSMKQRFAAVIMRIREPKTTALIFASGKMVSYCLSNVQTAGACLPYSSSFQWFTLFLCLSWRNVWPCLCQTHKNGILFSYFLYKKDRHVGSHPKDKLTS